MAKSKMNELQIRLLAIAQCLDGVEVKGKDNWGRMRSAVIELEKLTEEVAGKKLVNEANE